MASSLRKSTFFDFLNRRPASSFELFMKGAVEDEDYINWSDYALPYDYGDAEAEYHAIRNHCAIFDVTPLQKIRVQGTDSSAFLDRLLTRPVSDLPPMRATYTIFCNEDGSIKDDAILYKYAADDYLIMPSDIDHSPYFASLQTRFGLNSVSFTNCGASLAGIAIQGPRSAAALKSMGYAEIEQLKPFEVRDYTLADGRIRIARTGFTADLGYECWLRPGQVETFMQDIDAARSALGIDIPGYGLSSLEACRLEGGFVVAGWDFATEVDPQPGFERTPFEVGLGWLVNLDAGDFVGRDALVAKKLSGPRFALRHISINENVRPDDGAKIFAESSGASASIGFVACSTWSWGLEQTIGNASIKSEHRDVADAWIEIDGKRISIILGRGPLIKLERRNQVPAPMET